MHDIAKVTLENEMDLVLAHKRSMKLAELAGLSLSAQTTFATAVSEVARNTIDHGKNGCLTLGISTDKKRSIIASIKDENLNEKENKEGLEYAKRLVDRLNVISEETDTAIELFYYLPDGEKIGIGKLDEWRSSFRNEPPLSPYDEIKRKNEQLQELAEKIKDSEAHYRMLTDTLPLMMFSLDESGSITYMNKWMENFVETGTELKNSPTRKLSVHEEDRSGPIESLLAEKQVIKGEWRIKNKAGDYLWHLVSIMPILSEHKPANWFGFLVDIHAQKMFEQALKDNDELKRVQEELRSNIVELNRSNEELQQFAYVASHDLQEPLRKIIFYSDYLYNKCAQSIDAKSATYLKSMIDASHRMRILIIDLLSFSQVDKKSLNIQPLDLNVVMTEAIHDYDMIIDEKQAIVNIKSLPTIDGDSTMIRRLFENLLSNALKYSKEGIIPEITVHAIDRDDEVEIVFSDNGIGFEEKYLGKMFTLFQRLHGRDIFAGTGLGLAICRKITEMHKGSITATSVVNEGSSFHILLPLKQKF